MPNLADYRQEPQHADNWCWAAVAVSMARYYQTAFMSQCEFVRRVLHRDSCPNAAFSVGAALASVRCLAETLESGVTFASVQGQLNFGFPVCARVEIDSLMSHVVVIVGCGTSSGDSTMLTILDPAENSSVNIVPYEHLQAGVFRGRWLTTYFTGPQS